ncbi:hypothetical protein BXZ70DRAFT_934980 [Cristinia sonorae]|uniref:Carbohydrate-binding module family 13 protein n=1 Tax=Cristinia sonorae TaxID=1940300 RepID=A0A8K0UPH2_9AGAR|nr:hypothetical protein BXZ70DRAFT_934980 [Cristinia sonorae]
MSGKIERGIYYISNAGAPIVMDMLSGESSDGARIGAWSLVDPSGINSYHQQWFIEPVDECADPYDEKYTIRNIKSGSYMDLANTIPYTNGATLIGRARGGDSQHWYIRPDEGGSVRFCNSVTETYLDLNQGTSSKGAVIAGWLWVGYGPSRFNQLWRLERVSRTGEEIREQLKSHPSIGQELMIRRPNAIFIVPPRAILQEIYKQSGLKSTRLRKGLFECDDFAFGLKAAVATWADKNLGADGFSVLCGMMFVDSRHGSHAINWTLSDDTSNPSLLVVEPQDGTIKEAIPSEYTVQSGSF